MYEITMIMMLMIEVSLKKYRILPRKNLFLWARLQHSRNLVFGYKQIFFSYFDPFLHYLMKFQSRVIWNIEKAQSIVRSLLNGSRSVQFSDLDHWTELFRSVQQYSEKPWNMAYSRYPKIAISGIIHTRSATRLRQQQHRAQLL